MRIWDEVEFILSNMEQTFLKRAVELTQEIQKEKNIEKMKERASHLEGFLTGAMEIFAVLAQKPL